MAKAHKVDFRADQNLMDWVNRYGPEDRSHQIREDLLVLKHLLYAGTKELVDLFTTEEACLVADVIWNGYPFQADWAASTAQTIASDVHDGIKLNRLDEKWNIADEKGLVEKINNLSPLAGLALLHLCRLFWSQAPDRPDYGKDAVAKLFHCRK